MAAPANNDGTLDSVLLETDTHDQFLRMLMGSLVATTKQSNTLPKSGLDYKYNASFAAFRNARDSTSSKSTQLMKQLLSYCNNKDGDATSATQLNEQEIDPYFYSQVVDVIDMLLERAERTLSRLDADKFGQETSAVIQQSLLFDKERIIRENMKDIPKPQLPFLSTIDNRRDTVFQPKLSRKFHARIEYKPVVQYTDENNTQGFYSHPYEFELQRLEYPGYLLKKPKSAETPMPDRLRPYDLIDTESALHRLIDELKPCKEIAVDLEHHSIRSFLGLTCLMQLSSRSKDYIVDTLALRTSLWQLGEIFANPKIVKVFHGCENDIYWLQRDLGLYVVNCFDTYLAAKQLRFPALSLAHLVRVYCGVTLDKTHQLSDWRQRPLGEDMLQYARCDTMYLLYIFDMMRRDLWNAASPTVAEAYNTRHESEGGSVDYIEAVLAGSKRLCLNVYVKPAFDPEGYQALLALDTKLLRAMNGSTTLTPTQERIITALWDWRDQRARDEDESVLFVLSNAELVRVALVAPRSLQDLRDKIASQALAILTPYALEHLDDIAAVILTALGGSWEAATAPATVPSSSAASSLVASTGSNKRTAVTATMTSTAASAPSIMSFTPSAAASASASSTAATAAIAGAAAAGVSTMSILTSIQQHNSNVSSTSSVASSSMSTIGNASSFAAQSPVLPLHEMFRRAGWKTPMQQRRPTDAPFDEAGDERHETIGGHMDVDEEIDENTERLIDAAGATTTAATVAATPANAAKNVATGDAPVHLIDMDVATLGPVASWSPLIFEAIKPTSSKASSTALTAHTATALTVAHPPDSDVRVSKSLESLYKSLEGKIGLEKELRNIAFGQPSSVAASVDVSGAHATESAAAGAADDNTLPTIPRSFEEIYHLAGKIRSKKQQQNQQGRSGSGGSSGGGSNKRDHDAMLLSKLPRGGGDDDDDEDDDGEDGEGAGDLHAYLVKQGLAKEQSSKKAPAGGSDASAAQSSNVAAGENREVVEQTLQLAKEVGWLANDDQAAAVREEHYRVLAAQQSSLAGLGDAAGASSSSANSTAGVSTSTENRPSKTRGQSPNAAASAAGASTTSATSAVRGNSAGRRQPASTSAPVSSSSNAGAPQSFTYAAMPVIGALPATGDATTSSLHAGGSRGGPHHGGAANRYGNNNNHKKHGGGVNSNNAGSSSSWRQPSHNPYFREKPSG